MTNDPKRTPDEFGVLGAPRFVPNPPPRVNGGGQRMEALTRIATELRQNPGKWAAVMQSKSRHAVSNGQNAFRRGRFGTPSRWEATVRTDPETKMAVLYVRYVVQAQAAGARGGSGGYTGVSGVGGTGGAGGSGKSR